MTSIVEIQNQVTVVVDESTDVATVSLITPGPQGPPGANGANAVYIHNQVTPSATWIISHNMGFKPSVELLNSGSQEIEGDVIHTSQNVTVAYFNTPISGFARLN